MRPRVLALVVLVLVLPACSGKDAAEAEQLLAQASAAQRHVSSQTISMHVWGEADGQRVDANMTVGGYSKGPHKGDFFLSGSFSGVPGGGSFEAVRRDGSGWIELGGRREALPATPTSQPAPVLAAIDPARYVTSVGVRATTLAGVPMHRITGTLDTSAFMHDVLQGTGDLGSQLPLDKLDDVFGDTHAVLYVDDASHLVTRALVDLPLKADGKTFVLHMDFAVTGIDAPVRFPTL